MDAHTVFVLFFSAIGAIIYNEIMIALFRFMTFKSKSSKNFMLLSYLAIFIVNIPAILIGKVETAAIMISFSSLIALAMMIKYSLADKAKNIAAE
jgi:hypothetical protein